MMLAPSVSRLIAVTGANGFIGKAVCARLAHDGHRVRAIIRTPATIPNSVEIRYFGDPTSALPPLFEGCDAVINCAARVHITRREDPVEALAAYRAINRGLACDLARSARDAGVARFVQVSSVAAMGTAVGGVLRDGDPERPKTPYGIAKLEGDHALAALAGPDFGMLSLRLPATFGPGVAVWFKKLMAAAWLGVPLPLGQIHNLRSFVYVDNIAEALSAAAIHSHREVSGIYLVTDSAPLSTAELYRKLLNLAGQPDRAWNWPEGFVRGAARLVLGSRASSLIGNAAYDGSRFTRDFAWCPSVSFDDALRITMAATP